MSIYEPGKINWFRAGIGGYSFDIRDCYGSCCARRADVCYLSEYANKRFRAFAKPLIEICAGIPTVVYGFFAALAVAPFIRDTGSFLGLDVSSESALAAANYAGLIKKSLRVMFPEVKSRRDKRLLYGLVSSGTSFQLRDIVLGDPNIIGKTEALWVPASDDVDMLVKGHSDRNAPEGERRLKDNELMWIDRLSREGRIQKYFNKTFFTAGDSREPEQAGIWGAVVGSFLTLVVTLVLSFPMGAAGQMVKLPWMVPIFMANMSMWYRCGHKSAG